MKCSAKLTLASSRKSTVIRLMAGLSKKPMLASWVEKPPTDRVEKEWQMASNIVIPAIQ